MICRINAKFDNTESAQAAARTIKERVGDVQRLRLRYSQQIPDRVYINSIDYTDTGIMMQTSPPLYEYPTSRAWPYGSADILSSEASEECALEVYAESSELRRIRQILINNGGYNVTDSQLSV